jgi:hypothetical protein
METLPLLPTFHALEPDLAFKTVLHAKFRLHLKEVTGKFASESVEIAEAHTLLVYGFDAKDKPMPLQLLLVTRLLPATIQQLSVHFPLLAQAPGDGFCFQIKDEAFARYGMSWCLTKELGDWLEIGESAFLDLNQYDLVAYYQFEAQA